MLHRSAPWREPWALQQSLAPGGGCPRAAVSSASAVVGSEGHGARRGLPIDSRLL